MLSRYKSRLSYENPAETVWMRLSVVPSWTMITCSGLRPSIDGLRVFDPHFCFICCQFCHSEPVLERFCDAGCSKMAIWSKDLWHLKADFDHFIMKKCHILTMPAANYECDATDRQTNGEPPSYPTVRRTSGRETMPTVICMLSPSTSKLAARTQIVVGLPCLSRTTSFRGPVSYVRIFRSHIRTLSEASEYGSKYEAF